MNSSSRLVEIFVGYKTSSFQVGLGQRTRSTAIKAASFLIAKGLRRKDLIKHTARRPPPKQPYAVPCSVLAPLIECP